MFYYKNKRLPHNLRIKMQSFCYFKINNFILKTKTAPKNNYYRISSKTVSNKYGLPNLTKLIQGGSVVFFSYRKCVQCTYLFTNKFSDNLSLSFQSLNRFFNTLYGNECY